MKTFIDTAYQLIDDSPNVRIAMHRISQDIKHNHPMLVNDKVDTNNLTIIAHWQNIIFRELTYGADYVSEAAEEGIVDSPETKAAIDILTLGSTNWYQWDGQNYEPVNKNKLKAIISTEFNRQLQMLDDTSDWDDMFISPMLNYELDLQGDA